jgi:hypothetical protein
VTTPSITSLDLSNNTALTYLNCSDSNLIDINISQNTALQYFNASHTGQTQDFSFNQIDFSNNIHLKTIKVYQSHLNTLDLSNNTELEVLWCGNNNFLDTPGVENWFSTLDLSHNTALTDLWCDHTWTNNVLMPHTNTLRFISLERQLLTSFDVTEYSNLEILNLNRNINLGSIDVSQNPALEFLIVNKCGLTNLDVTHNPHLKYLYIGYQYDVFDNDPYNNISSIDLSRNPELIHFIANDINLYDVSFTHNPVIKKIQVINNHISNLDLKNNPLLRELQIINNNLSSLDLSNNPDLRRLHCELNNLTELNLKNGHNDLITYFDARNNPNLTCIEVDDPQAAGSGQGNYANWFKDPGAHYSTNCSAGITNNIAENIRLYPNPAHQNIYIDNFEGNYKLINENGQCVQQGHTTKQIAINGLKSGFYILELESGNAKVRKKIMIQH